MHVKCKWHNNIHIEYYVTSSACRGVDDVMGNYLITMRTRWIGTETNKQGFVGE